MSVSEKQSRLHLATVPLACLPLLLLLLYPVVGDWTVFFGRFHPVVLHLPIGILGLTTLLELIQVASFGHFKFSTRLPLFIGTTTSIAAMTLGILLMSGEAMEGELVVSHLRWGIATAAAAVIALTLRSWPHYSTHKLIPFFYRFTLIATCGIMTWASHQGASITHGETYLTDHLPWKTNEPSEKDIELAKGLSLPIDEKRVYEHLIVPIFDSKCYECHKSRSFKGKLIMDTYAGLLEGGATGPAIVPGHIKDSLAITRTYLPLANEEHMPPANKPQLTPEETLILEWWVEQGSPIEKQLIDLTPNEKLQYAINATSELLLTELNTAHEAAHDELSEKEVAQLRAPLKEAMIKLEVLFPSQIRYKDQQSASISVSSFNHSWTDQDVAELQPIVSNISELVLPRSKLTAESVSTINKMSKLEVLDLRNANADDSFIQALNLPNLKRLNLFQNPVSSDSAPALSLLPNLETLYLSLSQFDLKSVEKLREQMPNSEIVFENPIETVK